MNRNMEFRRHNHHDDNDLERRIEALEKEFDHGGRVWAIENTRTLVVGMCVACAGLGGFIWYLIDQLVEAMKK